MAVGRPPEIQDHMSTLRRPQPFLDSIPRGFFDRSKASVAFLCDNLDLYAILNRTIHMLYNGNRGARILFNVDSITKVYYLLESDLLIRTKGLAPHLSVMEAEESTQEITSAAEHATVLSKRQKTCITTRYPNARILDHRAVLDGLFEAVPSDEADTPNLKIMRQAGGNNVSLAVNCAIKITVTGHNMPKMNGFQAPNIPTVRSSPFRQLANDTDLENFMFPVDMQSFGGQLVGMEQPFI